MARPETPIDPLAGPLAAFAMELRKLREHAGVTYRVLAQRGHCSPSALNEAANGRQLPTWLVTEAFVKGCGADPQQWEARWQAVAAEVKGDSNTAAAPRNGSGAVAAPSGSSDVGDHLPSGDVPPLSSITSPQDFHLVLRALRVRAGNPSLRELSVLARKHGDHVLPRSTLAGALDRTDRLPSLEIVVAFLSACDVPATEVDAVKTAWTRVAYLLQRNSMPGSTRWQDSCPYLGLAAFTQDQAEVFHGRSHITIELMAKLADRVRGGVGMLVVAGPSGAGKSSLLQAGLLPALAKSQLGPGSQDWPTLVMTPGSAPLDRLAVPLAQRAGLNSAEVKESLAEQPDTAHLNARQALLAYVARHAESEPRISSGRLVLIVDQFEEVFTIVSDQAERAAFITSLCAMAGVGHSSTELPPAIVVLGLRADFLGNCTAYAPLAEAVRSNVFVVGPMTEVDLRSAITGPAEVAGLSIEAGLVDNVLAELRSTGTDGGFDEGALPLLSQAMLLTWEHREGTTLTRHAYAAGGGLRNGIQTSAEEAYHNLTTAQQEAARRLFRRMVTFTDRGQLTRRQIPVKDLNVGSSSEDDISAALKEFTNKRLITLGRDTAEIVHEVLVHTWKRLGSWVDRDREWLRLSRELEGVASVWEKNGQDPAFLYQGSRLADALERAKEADFPVLPVAQSFLDSSTRYERRRTRKLRGLRTSVGLLAVVTLLAGVIALQQHLGKRDLTSRTLTFESRFQAPEHPYDSMLMAVEADKLAKSPETLGALLSAQSQSLAGQLVDPLADHADAIKKVTFSHGGSLLATASEHGTAQLWNVADHKLISTLPTLGSVNDVEFSPDGKILVTAEKGGIARLWSTVNYRSVATLRDDSLIDLSVATFNLDGSLLATASEHGTAQLWNVADRKIIFKINNPSQVDKVVFSPTETNLATTAKDGVVRLWNVTNPSNPTQLDLPLLRTSPSRLATRGSSLRQADPPPSLAPVVVQPPSLAPVVQPLTQSPIRINVSSPTTTGPPLEQVPFASFVSVLAFSQDGVSLATTSEDNIVRLWGVHDTHGPNLINDLPKSDHNVTAIVFSPDGKILVTADESGTMQLWYVATRKLVGTLKTGSGQIHSLAFQQDGHTLATAGSDHIVRLWAINDKILSPPAIASDLQDMAFSPDGHTLATVDFDGKFLLWDREKRSLINMPMTIPSKKVMFSRSGRILATADTDGVTRLWDVATKQVVGKLNKIDSPIDRIVFSPKNHTLAIIDHDGNLHLWNVVSPYNPVPIHPPSLARSAKVVTFSEDDLRLATADANGAQLWDTVSWQKIGTPISPPSPISRMVFRPNDGSLITAGEDGTIRRWKATDGSYIDTTLPSRKNLSENLSLAALSLDGGTLATISAVDETTITLWNMDHEGKMIATLTSPTGGFRSAMFGHDSHLLATKNKDSTVHLWDLESERVAKKLCDIIGIPSKDQWEKAMPAEFPYKPPCT